MKTRRTVRFWAVLAAIVLVLGGAAWVTTAIVRLALADADLRQAVHDGTATIIFPTGQAGAIEYLGKADLVYRVSLRPLLKKPWRSDIGLLYRYKSASKPTAEDAHAWRDKQGRWILKAF
jgi:hypothetical protein